MKREVNKTQQSSKRSEQIQVSDMCQLPRCRASLLHSLIV